MNLKGFFGKSLYFPSLVNEGGAGTFLSNPDSHGLASNVEVPSGVREPTGSYLSPAHMCTTYALILLSVRLLCHLGFHELPGTSQDQKKGQ